MGPELLRQGTYHINAARRNRVGRPPRNAVNRYKIACTAVQAIPYSSAVLYLSTTVSKLFAPLKLPFMLGCMFHSAINLGLYMG